MARAPATLETEAVPECDRLESFPHPRHTARLFGHDSALATIEAARLSGRMHHAWLMAGPVGIGKATLAYRIATHLLSTGSGKGANAPDVVVAGQVRALSHPGLLVIRRPYDPKAKRFPATIPVDEVRRLRGFLARTADAGQWRIVIVDSADELNVNAANALLKALEEPPRQTVFLLISAFPQRLLATIRSRCRLLALSPLPAVDLLAAARQAWAAAGVDSPSADDLSALSGSAAGSVRRLLELSAVDGLKLQRRVEVLFDGLPEIEWAEAHALAEELAPNTAEPRLTLFFELLLSRIGGVAKAAAGGVVLEADRASARRLAASGTLASWAELWESIVRDKAETLALNLDRRLLVLDTLARLQRTAQGVPPA